MDNILKLPAQQATFNATNRLVDLIIPGNSGVYNLSETYISIQCRTDGIVLDVTTADGPLAQAGGLVEADAVADLRLNIKHHPTVASIYDQCAVPIECLVRNCSMTSATRGKVEDIRRSDTLRGTMKSYTLDKEDVEGRSLGGFAGMAKSNPWVSGRFASLVGVGSTASTYQPHEVRIMLKDLFNIAEMAEDWDSSVYGDTRIHLELSLDRLHLQQSLAGAALFNRIYHNQQTGGESGPADVEYGQAVDVVVAVGATVTNDFIIMQAQYGCLEDSPFFVNQMLEVTTNYIQGTGGTSAAKYPADASVRWVVVKDITWDKTTKRVTLGFGTGSAVFESGAVGVASLTCEMDVKGAAVVSLANKLSFPSVELTAVRRSDVSAGPTQIQYTQFQTQSDQWNNGSSLERTYYLPAQTTNAYMMLPSSTQTGFSDILGCARLEDYRFTINGESVTNRAVPFMPVPTVNAAVNDAKCDHGSSIHYTLISETMMNAGKRFYSLEESVYDQHIPSSIDRPVVAGKTGWLTLAECPQKACYMLAIPIPISTIPTPLTISLNGNFAGGSGEIHIYSEVRSVI